MIQHKLAITPDDFLIIDQLADIIWREHYIPIIGVDQVEYMLDKFQSVSAIKDQIKEGYEYYILNYENNSIGYISIKNEGVTLFLSKIYILSNYRGKKLGKNTLEFIEDIAYSYNLKSITLTVNKYNADSINAYEKLGFVKDSSIMIDIGNGFMMDDYKMIKQLSNS